MEKAELQAQVGRGEAREGQGEETEKAFPREEERSPGLVRVERELLRSTDNPVLGLTQFAVDMPTKRLGDFSISPECVEGYIQASFELPQARWELEIFHDDPETYQLKLVDAEDDDNKLTIYLDREDVASLAQLCQSILELTREVDLSALKTYLSWPEMGSSST